MTINIFAMIAGPPFYIKKAGNHIRNRNTSISGMFLDESYFWRIYYIKRLKELRNKYDEIRDDIFFSFFFLSHRRLKNHWESLTISIIIIVYPQREIATNRKINEKIIIRRGADKYIGTQNDYENKRNSKGNTTYSVSKSPPVLYFFSFLFFLILVAEIKIPEFSGELIKDIPNSLGSI